MKTDKKILKALNKKPKPAFFWRGYILDWVVDLAIAGIIVYLITTFAFQNMYVVGASMSPTLKNGETVIINKLTYLIKKPIRNDIVAFKHRSSPEKELHIVKRVIGIPGDKIEVINDRMYINSEIIDQTIAIIGNMEYPIIIPERAYFVIGDNKANSLDSRYQEIGLIPEEELTGRIIMRIWPFWKLQIL